MVYLDYWMGPRIVSSGRGRKCWQNWIIKRRRRWLAENSKSETTCITIVMGAKTIIFASKSNLRKPIGRLLCVVGVWWGRGMSPMLIRLCRHSRAKWRYRCQASTLRGFDNPSGGFAYDGTCQWIGPVDKLIALLSLLHWNVAVALVFDSYIFSNWRKGLILLISNFFEL